MSFLDHLLELGVELFISLRDLCLSRFCHGSSLLVGLVELGLLSPLLLGLLLSLKLFLPGLLNLGLIVIIGLLDLLVSGSNNLSRCFVVGLPDGIIRLHLDDSIDSQASLFWLGDGRGKDLLRSRSSRLFLLRCSSGWGSGLCGSSWGSCLSGSIVENAELGELVVVVGSVVDRLESEPKTKIRAIVYLCTYLIAEAKLAASAAAVKKSTLISFVRRFKIEQKNY